MPLEIAADKHLDLVRRLVRFIGIARLMPKPTRPRIFTCEIPVTRQFLRGFARSIRSGEARGSVIGKRSAEDFSIRLASSRRTLRRHFDCRRAIRPTRLGLSDDATGGLCCKAQIIREPIATFAERGTPLLRASDRTLPNTATPIDRREPGS
jgi:hypothetical protein